jgi:hypothetical protein
MRPSHHVHTTEEISFGGISHQSGIAKIAHIQKTDVHASVAVMQTVLRERFSDRRRRKMALAAVPRTIHRHTQDRE